LLYPHPTTDVATRIDETTASIRRWIERDGASDLSLPSTIDEAKKVVAEWFDALAELLVILEVGSPPKCYVIPDTNALLANPDLATYERAVGRSDFTAILIPPILSELDNLKDRGSAEVGKKAQAFIRRLKGLRDKGRLNDGVSLTRTVSVMTTSREVDPAAVLDWLDPAVMDDRILAAALRFQSDHAHSTVVLVTSDLNLQNKADATGLPYAETPPTDAQLSASLVAGIERRGER